MHWLTLTNFSPTVSLGLSFKFFKNHLTSLHHRNLKVSKHEHFELFWDFHVLIILSSILCNFLYHILAEDPSTM